MTTFRHLADKMKAKVNMWSIRPLSQGGKEVFIKSVLQAIPVYSMSVFLFPKALRKSLEAIMAKFWWQKGQNRRGIHWCDWFSLCQLKDEGGLGFRDLMKFNCALLAKQGLLEQGLRWKVGSGTSINIWNDFWLPLSPPKCVSSALVDSIIRVADLMIPGTATWNSELLEEIFSRAEMECILSIPLSRYSQADCLVWSGEHSVLYSVRSGYRLLMGSILVPSDDKKLFRTLWTIDCPPKFKIQVWKFIWNYAPTKSTLFTKRLTSDSLCPLCISAMEDITHALIDCPLASSIWSYLGYNWPIAVHHGGFKEWLSWLLTNTPNTKHVEISVTLYAIWYARNKFVHEGSRQTREEILTFIQSMTTDLQNISARLQGPSLPSPIAWSAPSPPFVKANFDAKFCSVSHSSWSAVIIRDNQGHVLGACCCKALQIPSPFVAEAMSLIHAISLADDLGFHSVIFEGDSLTLIKKMNSDALDFSEISALVWEAKGLARNLHACRFLFVPRGGNQAAHALARESSLDSADRFWVEEVPPKVFLLVEADRRYAPPS
ncbi:hypothetical protein GQ457_06G007780 [Hibiscus cannabinus]